MSDDPYCPHHPSHKYVAGCDGCKRYQRERVARNRADRLAAGRISHGKRSGWDAGCRCTDCRAVKAASDRTYRRAKA